ncbi:hypothetical protein KSS87_003487 [Heliosperma pusillum]|nr:hypothetical protein KSS87_003487 [Heliosperma pusillum]
MAASTSTTSSSSDTSSTTSAENRRRRHRHRRRNRHNESLKIRKSDSHSKSKRRRSPSSSYSSLSSRVCLDWGIWREKEGRGGIWRDENSFIWLENGRWKDLEGREIGSLPSQIISPPTKERFGGKMTSYILPLPFPPFASIVAIETHLSSDSEHETSSHSRRRKSDLKQKKSKGKDKEKRHRPKRHKHKKEKDQDGRQSSGPVQLSKFLGRDKEDDGVRRSVVSGKKIKMKLEKSKEDKFAENKRNELLKFLNASYD